jgi:hypothetical protein
MRIAVFVEDIFALNGNPTRMMHLQTIFDSPDRYGKGLNWAGYTVHDAANLMLRYIKSLPEPIIPYEAYDSFTEPFRPHIDADDILAAVDSDATLLSLQKCTADLSANSRQLLLYLLDLLAIFDDKSHTNKMTPQRLISRFQPGLLSKPPSYMDAHEHHLAAQTMLFMVKHETSLLGGSWGTLKTFTPWEKSKPSDPHKPPAKLRKRRYSGASDDEAVSEPSSTADLAENAQEPTHAQGSHDGNPARTTTEPDHDTSAPSTEPRDETAQRLAETDASNDVGLDSHQVHKDNSGPLLPSARTLTVSNADDWELWQLAERQLSG